MQNCGIWALHIKDDMLSAGVAPNTVAWSLLISVCANAGLVEQAIQLFEEMLLAGCEPNTQCCNILLHACVEACQYDRAFRLFQSWKGSSVSEPTSGDYKSNTTSSNLSAEHAEENCSSSVANCISNSHHLNFSKKFPFTPTTATYNILMKACGTDYYRANALMDEMIVVGLSPNHISWSILIDICGGLGNLEGAIQILRHMLGAGIQPDVVAYTTTIKLEAWIVVLAVLRMFKENYHTHGHSVKDDILIILGVSKEDTSTERHNLEVKNAIIKLLRDELGLKVLSAGPRFKPRRIDRKK